MCADEYLPIAGEAISVPLNSPRDLRNDLESESDGARDKMYCRIRHAEAPARIGRWSLVEMSQKSANPQEENPDARLKALEQEMLRLMMSVNDALSQRRSAREVRVLRARLSVVLRDIDKLKAQLARTAVDDSGAG